MTQPNLKQRQRGRHLVFKQLDAMVRRLPPPPAPAHLQPDEKEFWEYITKVHDFSSTERTMTLTAAMGALQIIRECSALGKDSKDLVIDDEKRLLLMQKGIDQYIQMMRLLGML